LSKEPFSGKGRPTSEKKLKKESLTGFTGKVTALKLQPKSSPYIKDDKKFFAWVKRNSAFDCLQRRLNESAINERFEAKKRVPGIEFWDYLRLSVTKAK